MQRGLPWFESTLGLERLILRFSWEFAWQCNWCNSVFLILYCAAEWLILKSERYILSVRVSVYQFSIVSAMPSYLASLGACPNISSFSSCSCLIALSFWELRFICCLQYCIVEGNPCNRLARRPGSEEQSKRVFREGKLQFLSHKICSSHPMSPKVRKCNEQFLFCCHSQRLILTSDCMSNGSIEDKQTSWRLHTCFMK